MAVGLFCIFYHTYASIDLKNPKITPLQIEIVKTNLSYPMRNLGIVLWFVGFPFLIVSVILNKRS